MEMEQHEDGSPLQELTQKIKEFIAEEADGQPYAFTLDALMNTMIHIASDARPDVTIPTILDFLMDDLKSYQAASSGCEAYLRRRLSMSNSTAQEMVASGEILPAHPSYVRPGEPDVARQLQERLPGATVVKRALDGAKVDDVLDNPAQ
jgi:hypothetical protein